MDLENESNKTGPFYFNGMFWMILGMSVSVTGVIWFFKDRNSGELSGATWGFGIAMTGFGIYFIGRIIQIIGRIRTRKKARTLNLDDKSKNS